MSLLFTVENKSVVPTTEVLLLSPYKEIWARDKTSGKFNAINEFAYIEFMMSVKKTNIYRGYSETERMSRLGVQLFNDEKYVPDDLIKEGMRKLQEFQLTSSPTFAYYQSAMAAAYKIQRFFENVDLTMLNLKTGLPVYKPQDITSALMDTEKVLQSLLTLEEKVNNELFESAKIKGQKVVSVFANPDTI
jgi:hypothetical protein